jgi:hypothetical protein
VAGVPAVRKITVEVPPELLERAQRASGAGVTQTVRAGLELVVASEPSRQLRQFRGKLRFSRRRSSRRTGDRGGQGFFLSSLLV